MLKFKSVIKDREIKYPSKFSEITSDYLLKMTSDIKVGDGKSLIALCYKIKSTKIHILSNKQVDDRPNINITSLFVKCGDLNSDYIKNLQAAQTIFITPENISYGLLVNNAKEKLSLKNVIKDMETEYSKRLDDIEGEIVCLSYRIVESNFIVGVRDLNVTNTISSEFGY